MRTPGHREEAGRNVLFEYRAWKCGKEGLSASTISASRVSKSGGREVWATGSVGALARSAIRRKGFD